MNNIEVASKITSEMEKFMNKRYQIFISSTIKDLKGQRSALTQTILRKGYYPAGMEWFPGIDEE